MGGFANSLVFFFLLAIAIQANAAPPGSHGNKHKGAKNPSPAECLAAQKHIVSGLHNTNSVIFKAAKADAHDAALIDSLLEAQKELLLGMSNITQAFNAGLIPELEGFNSIADSLDVAKTAVESSNSTKAQKLLETLRQQLEQTISLGSKAIEACGVVTDSVGTTASETSTAATQTTTDVTLKDASPVTSTIAATVSTTTTTAKGKNIKQFINNIIRNVRKWAQQQQKANQNNKKNRTKAASTVISPAAEAISMTTEEASPTVTSTAEEATSTAVEAPSTVVLKSTATEQGTENPGTTDDLSTLARRRLPAIFAGRF